MKKKLLFLAFLLTLSIASFAQCPMCKTSVEMARQQSDKPIGQGLNKGILYLLALPYLMVGTVGGAYYYNWKKRQNS